MKDIVIKYFKAWNSFDLIQLRNYMHDSIHLRDWSNNLTGIDQVIELSANTFKKYPKATIELCNIAKFSENKIVAQIEIHLDANEKLEVIDIFEITNNKIINLTAYKI